MLLSAPARNRQLIPGSALDDPVFHARLSRSLQSVEDRLRRCTADASAPVVADLVGHLIDSGGKRLRPLLVLLGAEFGDPELSGVFDAAVMAELVHVASLYHDDVMDRAEIRHGVASANARWNNRLAAFAGDWLLARAARISAELGPGAMEMNAAAAGRLVRGQMRELAGPAPGETGTSHYFAVASDKSASLISLSLTLGAAQADAPQTIIEILAEYGENLGIAFQISDDLLDINSPTYVSGKERGRDLVAGVTSLPVLLALAGDDRRDGELRRLLIRGADAGAEANERALELFRHSPALVQADALMHEYLQRARTALALLPERCALRALDALCDFVAHRSD